MTVLEVNYDGLVGPTHNYAGLSSGNLASQAHGGQVSNPREAALQGLAKMGMLVRFGLCQGVLPPHDRPAITTLRQLGFRGNDREVVQRAGAGAPGLLAACYSASSMWAANAACVAPSVDTVDGRVHFTPANLLSTLHRSIEPEQTALALRRLFPEARGFVHHEPLPHHLRFGDEGAANHTRLWGEPGAPGFHLFVYGMAEGQASGPQLYPARQTRLASEGVARLHGLDPQRVAFVQQAPQAIDGGVFHNDVIAVGHGRFFFYHEQAYLKPRADVEALLRGGLQQELVVRMVPASRVSLEQTVRSYLFNSQLVFKDGQLLWLAPGECAEDRAVHDFLVEMAAEPAIGAQVHFLDVRESMRNGGGPACLRLRVPLTADEWERAHEPARLTPERLAALEDWVRRHYRDRLVPEDLLDPQLVDEVQTALDELTQLLVLGSDFYPFQRTAVSGA